MSFVIIGPDAILAKAADLAGIGSTIADANAIAAAQTTAIPAAAADQVSTAVAALLGSHAQSYQAIGTQMAAVHDQIVQTLTNNAGAYASAEAANVQQSLLAAINAPAQALLGRPNIGDGADG
ncbi:PE-PGRS family protein PE_PGRS16 [Mycobacterium simulans]|uniref:PE-PGRS family protein PE_PGRS16 n=1 Tax=Mycobacterium simulans TaxID=627089 RepID=A0A7Z7IM94_9MYCO|nr:PE family protein [Mycobacterium simulans]SOJ56207.1 PE-PGRS family protein PE_PGRS16 [Mycobacterium simulans]